MYVKIHILFCDSRHFCICNFSLSLFVHTTILQLLHLAIISELSSVISKKNQRTNGPVNAHLISGSIISTKTSFCQIGHCCKIGHGQLRVINCEELEFIMFHAKFHDHRTITEGKDF